MLAIQACNLQNYLEAYQITQDDRYREAVQSIIRYVTRFLTDHKRGGFYASQDADLRRRAGSDSSISGEQYFVLGETNRLALGIPHIDQTIYTGWNGLMVKSYLKVYQIFLEQGVREFALKTLELLYRERYRPGRGVAHLVSEDEPQSFGFLADQVFLADAFLEAYVTTCLLYTSPSPRD